MTRGSPVQINVSTGPKPVGVPNVVGLTYDQASATLQSEGFGVKRVDVDSDQPKDQVVVARSRAAPPRREPRSP